jgi:hypothetical protein
VPSRGAAPWGDIPVESDTEHVDASYSGGNSDGSSAAPWTTIQAGVDAGDGLMVISYEGQGTEPCQAHSTGLVPPDPLK